LTVWPKNADMRLNGKRGGFEMAGLLAFAQTVSIRPSRVKTMNSNAIEAVVNRAQ
tara:strand:+ start:26850 stop:27014 length:165 start_codon:yes stop_codon:yes gene_type:complete